MLRKGRLLDGARRAATRTSFTANKFCNSTSKSKVSLEISPRICLYDVPSSITVKGMCPGTPVTLKTSLSLGAKKNEFVSHAHYITDGKGEVNNSLDASVGGSYEGVFPMGLLTTLSPAPGVYKYARCLKTDASTPDTVHVSLYKGHLPMEAHFTENESSRPEAIASRQMVRHAMGPGVRRIPVRQGRVRGTLFLPPGPGPFPAVLDTFGAIEGLIEIRAALLASRGIAAFTLALFNFEDLPRNLERVELEYYEEAVDYLLGRPEVIPDRCGFVSVSQSAFSALACGAWMDRIKAVVTINGFPFFYDCHFTYKDREYFGDGVDFDQVFFKVGGEEAVMGKDIMGGKMDPEHPLVVPVEEADDDTYFLAIAGDRDNLHLDNGLQTLQKRLAARGRSDKIKTVLYPGVGHILEVPYTPRAGFLWQNSPPTMKRAKGRSGVALFYGSDQPYLYSLAQVQHWFEIQKFILHHIRDKSSTKHVILILYKCAETRHISGFGIGDDNSIQRCELSLTRDETMTFTEDFVAGNLMKNFGPTI
ncbi:acyl-coenzyme A thioesterase 5-like [Oratosquilla oratoria]|uniref:acyl-coenzyme A thioesterase 5-like n=1 Tax=Oratosquilla oratoria TaxID=337810 RepID=UPI003F775575